MNKWLFPGLALLLLSACSSEEPGPRADDKYKTRGAFCDGWADAACNDDAVMNCGSSRAACLEHQATYCLNLLPTGYSSVNAETCIDAVKRAYRDAELTAEELKVVQRLQGECSQLVDGGRVDGESCTLSTECNTIQGSICVIKVGDEVGTCQVPNVVGGGASCREEDRICEDGYFCSEVADYNCIQSRYAPDSGQTEAVECSHDAECSPAGFCEIPTDETSGICVPLLPSSSSASCTRDEQCVSDFCLLSATRPYCTDLVILTGESSVCSNF
jgi:hypothetical protein